MTTKQALAVFGDLEPIREEDMGDLPTYDVRLDAVTGRYDAERSARVRVTCGRETGDIAAAEWRAVLDIADKHGVRNVTIANDGIELS